MDLEQGVQPRGGAEGRRWLSRGGRTYSGIGHFGIPFGVGIDLARSLRVKAILAAALVLPLLVFAAQDPLETRAGELIGAPVLNPAGEHLGEVTDIVFDARDGSIRYVVIEFGGWLGLGEGEAAFSAAQLVPRGGYVMLDVPEGSLRRTPAHEEPAWPAMRATKLIEREVLDRRHRDAGEIVDLLIDLRAPRVHHALINLRDDWKPGERLVRVPIEEFSLPRDMGDHATLNIARERLGTQD